MDRDDRNVQQVLQADHRDDLRKVSRVVGQRDVVRMSDRRNSEAYRDSMEAPINSMQSAQQILYVDAQNKNKAKYLSQSPLRSDVD